MGKVKQNLDFFHMPVELEVQTEGNPEIKTIQISGKESDFDLEVFGRPKPNGIILDPHNYILKSSERLHVRSIIARGEALAEQGRYYDAIQQYSQALDLQKNNSLAEFRMGEAFFYQKNYSAAANAFRDALDGDLDPSYKWVEVWSHIYLGKIYDVAGDRTRAVNEYSKAQQTNDDTGGAQEEARRYITQPYTEGAPQTARCGHRIVGVHCVIVVRFVRVRSGAPALQTIGRCLSAKPVSRAAAIPFCCTKT